MSNSKKICASDNFEIPCANNLKKIRETFTASPRSMTFDELCNKYFGITASSFRNYIHTTGRQHGRISEYAATNIANVTLLDYDKIIGKANLDSNDINILQSSFQTLDNQSKVSNNATKIDNIICISESQLEELIEKISDKVVEKLQKKHF